VWLSNAIALVAFTLSYAVILQQAIKRQYLVLPVKLKKLLKRVGVK
jgi:hypothetical protein